MANKPFSNDKNDFVLYTEKAALLLVLSDEAAGKVIKAVIHHEQHNVIDKKSDNPFINDYNPGFEMNTPERIAYDILADSLEANTLAWIAGCNADRANGGKGGRPKKPKGNPTKPKGNPTKPDTDTDTDTDKETATAPDTIFNMGDKTPRKTFKKPSAEDITLYCQEKGIRIDVDVFIDYYEANGWMIGRNHMKNWKAAVNNWSRRKMQGGNQAPDFMQMANDLSGGL